jgi:hypothetical protein
MSWSRVPPEFAAKVLAAFDAHKHKVLATLRADGSPRVSGTELALVDRELYLGSMPDARKALDLRRDARFALHSAPVDTDLVVPDVKLAGTAVEVTSPEEIAAFTTGREMPPGSFHLFRLDLTEVVCTWVADDLLHVESWHPDRGTVLATRS